MATFRVGSEDGTALEVTNLLGIAPTESFERGDPWGRDGKRRRTHAQWSLSTEMREPSELSEHLTGLLEKVEPVRDRVWALARDGHTTDWFCFVAARDLEHAIELDAKLLGRLAQFPGRLLIDTYSNEPD